MNDMSISSNLKAKHKNIKKVRITNSNCILLFINKSNLSIIIKQGKTTMKSKITLLRTITFILILVQAVLMVGFTTFYLLNIFDLKNIIQIDHILYGAFVLVFIDCMYLWIVMSNLIIFRQNTDLHAAEVIGSDVQAAYNFAQLGLVVVNEDDMVLWTNDIFKDRNINIIDLNILNWKPELRELVDNNESEEAVVRITESNREYDVKYLHQAGLFIFKDVTDHAHLFTESIENAPVVGLLSIDNYSDVIKTEEDFNDSVSKVKAEIFTYAKEYGLLLKRYRSDTYFILTNFKTLEMMREDNFSLINKVRNIGQGDDVPLTISLGLAHNHPEVSRLNELAEEALSIAMSRGGDQVVIQRFGSDMEFIGGKTEAQENRNRVKIRVLADSLISLIKASDNVLIMGHSMADMDALGSCLGIRAICEHFKKPSLCVFDLKNTEVKTRSAITSSFTREELNSLMISSKDAESKVNPNTLLVVVDVHIQKMTMAPRLLDLANKVVVIDHHRRAEEYIENPVFNHIDPSASSASELITEFIQFTSANPKILIKPMYASIMLSGILLDSQSFRTKSTGIRTFEACTVLKEFGADNAYAYDLLKDDFEEHMEVNKIVSSIKTIETGFVYCVAKDIVDDATLAKVANTCLSIKGMKAAFALGKVNQNHIKLSLRGDGSINVSFLAEKLGGGGHFSAAAALFDTDNMDEVVSMLESTIRANIKEASRFGDDKED